MHGLIFLQLQKFSQWQGGAQAWGRLHEEAQLPFNSYSAARAYPDEDALALIGAASRIFNQPEGAILEAFGAYLASDLVRLYGRLIQPCWKTLDVIENTEKLIHAAVRVGNPGAKPPVLECIRSTEDEVQVIYSSERRMCSLAKGIVKGLARYFGDVIEIAEDACMLKDDPFCALRLTRMTGKGTPTQVRDQMATEVYGYSVSRPPVSSGHGEPLNFLEEPVQGDELGRLGDYRVLQIVGEGGMGIVFRAEDTRLGRMVALKVMRPRISSEGPMRTRFLREARAMAAVKNDHVVTVFEVGTANNVPFLAMEFLEGEALDTFQKKVGRLPIEEVVRIGKEAALGLAAAHARGLIHRDIKPSNMWLEAPTGRVKILDFGLARASSEAVRVSLTGMVVGTPAFMAPEQARGVAVDHRADLFSLGCVLYSLCTEQPLFERNDILSTLTALATYDPEPPKALAAEVPPALSDLIMELLQKDPGRRPSSSQAVVESMAAIQRSGRAALGS